MENYKGLKRFERVVVFSIAFLLVLVVVSIFSFIRLNNVRKKDAKYETTIASLMNEKQALSLEIDSITNDEYLEELVRNKYGMVEEGETDIKFYK